MFDKKLKINALYSTAGLLLRTGLQAISFFIVSSTLGPDEMGKYITVFSICGLLAILFDFGRYYRLIADIKEHDTFSANIWTRMLEASKLFPFSVGAAFIIISLFFPDIELLLVLFMSLSILVLDRAFIYFSAVQIAVENMKLHFVYDVLQAGLRIAVTVLFVVLNMKTSIEWAAMVLLASVGAAIASLGWLVKQYPLATNNVESLLTILKTGASFSVSQLSQGASNEVDKLSLGYLSSMNSVGQYGVASRLLNLVVLPINAILRVVFPRYYNFDTNQQRFSYALKVLVPIFFIALIAAAGMYFLAFLIPMLLGEQYQGTEQILKVAAFIPMFWVCSLVFLDVLTVSGAQSSRAMLSTGFLVVNLILNIVLIPKYDYFGAAYATLLAFILYFISSIVIAWKHCRRLE